MPLKTSAAALAILIAAIPTVVTLCELRCVAPEVAEAPAAPPCHGGATPDKSSSAPASGGGHECPGHVLLARGGAGNIPLQLDRSSGAVPPASHSLTLLAATRSERPHRGCADLAPPAGRSPDILRL